MIQVTAQVFVVLVFMLNSYMFLQMFLKMFLKILQN